jgi:hypothetical protein
MFVNQIVVAISAICAIEVGSSVSRKVASWIGSESVVSVLTDNTRVVILRKIAEKAKDGMFPEMQEWNVFSTRCLENIPLREERKIEVAPFILASAIFYSANIGGKAEEIITAECDGVSLKREDFIGLLDLGIKYDEAVISKYVNLKTCSSVYSFLESAVISKDEDKVEEILQEESSPTVALFKGLAQERLSSITEIRFKDETLSQAIGTFRESKILLHRTFRLK